MCTVVIRIGAAGEAVPVLALRDEFVGRDFDEPDAWWPEQPDVIGGRDRIAGGSWCVTDVATATTALIVNRTERVGGTPSRGLLPLAAVRHGAAWTDVVSHEAMASFQLLLVAAGGVTVWTWDAVTLQRTELGAGTHLLTSHGVDADDAKTTKFAPWFTDSPVADWPRIVAGCLPSAAESALVVRRDYAGRGYGTVFGQLIDARPGRLALRSTRTPWTAAEWPQRVWRSGRPRPVPQPAPTRT